MDMRTGEIAPLAEFKKRGVDPLYLRPLADPGVHFKSGNSYPTGMKVIDPKNLSPRVRAMVAAGRRALPRRRPTSWRSRSSMWDPSFCRIDRRN